MRRVSSWWHSADPSGFINIGYFLQGKLSQPITLQKNLCATLEIVGYFSSDTALLVHELVSAMHTASYEFLTKPEESAECHKTLSLRVGSVHKATKGLVLCPDPT